MHKPNEHFTVIKGLIPEMKEAFLKARQMFFNGELTIQEYKANIPMGLILSSVVSLNYEVLRCIIADRENHRLLEWQYFCGFLLCNVERPWLIESKRDSEKI
jgi:hypothetical protein